MDGPFFFYMQLHGKKILIDPVAAEYASPVPFVDKAMEGSNVYSALDIPDDIDVMVLSHDHWDHLDYDFVRAIEPKVHHVVTGLGNGGYYEKWGYPLSKIHEEDWWTPVEIDKDLTVWFLPSRHFPAACCTGIRPYTAALPSSHRTGKYTTPVTAATTTDLKKSEKNSAVSTWPS